MKCCEAAAPCDESRRAAGEALLTHEIADRGGYGTDLQTHLYAALYDQWCREAAIAVRVGELLSDGMGERLVARALGITERQFEEAVDKLKRASCRLDGLPRRLAPGSIAQLAS